MTALILFDFDGTLADTAPDLAAAANRQRTRAGLEPLPLEVLRPYSSAGARGLLRCALNLTPADEAYEAQWDGGKGSHHPDYNPRAMGPHVTKSTRETEELLNAIVKVSEPWRAALAAGGAPHHEAGLSSLFVSCHVPSRRTTSAWCTRRLRRAPT